MHFLNTSVSAAFSGRLCPRKEPERGCLKRTSDILVAPANSTPILSLPPEVRACIFKYLIDDVDIIFKFDKKFNTSSSWAKWPEFNKNLCFLRASKIFEAEALALVKVEAISVEIDPIPDHNPCNPSDPRPTYSKLLPSAPQPVGLCLSTVRPHLRQLTIDARYTLHYLLETDFLETLPKLQTIRVRQTLWPREHQSNYRQTLRRRHCQRDLVKESLAEFIANNRHVGDYAFQALRCKYDNATLSMALNNPKLMRFQPILIEVQSRSNDYTSQPSRWAEDGPTFPVEHAVSNVRFSYEWPSKKLLNLEVDMYNQPMALAIKSEWTEIVPLRKESRHQGTVDGQTMIDYTYEAGP